MKCPNCDGTGRLYTSSWDNDGFPCPTCAMSDPTANVAPEDPVARDIGPDYPTAEEQ